MSNALELGRNSTDTGLPDAATVEHAINALSGVCGARILMEGNGGIQELHVLASPHRAPKKIIRDIETLLLVHYGYRIDYRRISLAQVADAGRHVPERVALGRVEHQRTAQQTWIEVELLDGQQRRCGTAPIGDDIGHAAGEAAVAAINGLFGQRTPLALRGVQCSTLGKRQVVTVYVVYKETEHLLGTAFVRSSVPAATARAVLAATNRRLNDWLQEHAAQDLAKMVGA